MVIPREQRYSTKNGSRLDSLGHFLAFLLLFASSRCCFRRVDFVTAPFLLYNSYLSFPLVRPIVAEFGCRCKWEKLLLKQLNINIFKQTWR